MINQAEIFDDWEDKYNFLKIQSDKYRQHAESCLKKYEKHLILYHAINKMVVYLGNEGKIDWQDPLMIATYDALHEIDGGAYNGKV